jgi:DNA-binding GntR family transcriptional regulator
MRVSGNGQYIFSAATLSHVVDLTEMKKKVTQISATDADIDNLYVSDASESHALCIKRTVPLNMYVILSSTRSRRRGDQDTENC